jgi:hypothetical protein
MTTATRAPKGGTTISGVFYKGGQFLPSDNEPKRGKFNKYHGKIASHKSQAKYHIRTAIKAYFKNDKGTVRYSITMAEMNIRKMNYFKTK